MNIKVMSRPQCIKYTYSQESKEPYFIISISNEFDEHPRFKADPNCLGICYLNFDDVEKGEKNCITESDIDYLEYFLSRAFKKHPHIENIIVHCEAGVSRSAGMAAALMKFYNDDDSLIFDNPIYCPNMTVYRTVLERLMGRIIDDEEIKTKEEKNIALWKSYHGLE